MSFHSFDSRPPFLCLDLWGRLTRWTSPETFNRVVRSCRKLVVLQQESEPSRLRDLFCSGSLWNCSIFVASNKSKYVIQKESQHLLICTYYWFLCLLRVNLLPGYPASAGPDNPNLSAGSALFGSCPSLASLASLSPRQVITLATSIEIIHTASLVHDTRRSSGGAVGAAFSAFVVVFGTRHKTTEEDSDAVLVARANHPPSV